MADASNAPPPVDAATVAPTATTAALPDAPPVAPPAAKKGRPPAKKLAKSDAAAPKKPSPKPRTPKAAAALKAKAPVAAATAPVETKKRPTAAEKKKLAAAASAAQANANAAAATAPEPAAEQSSQAAAAPAAEVNPMPDAELRRTSLHQIYLQVTATHRGQNDQLLRQFATKLEMDVCRASTTRSEYISGINYELTKLMQTEHASKGDTGGTQASATAPGAATAYGGYQGGGSEPPATSSDQHDGKPPASTASQPQPYMSAQSQAHATQTPSSASSSEGSFMRSLMSSEQSPSATYGQGGRGQLPSAAMYNAGNSMMQQNDGMQSSGQAQPGSSHGYDQHMQSQGHVPASTSVQMQQAYQYQQQQQQQHLQQQHHQSRPVPPVMTFQEFVVQVQRFDRNALLELMWNQRNTLLQWQRRVQQLEAQLSSRYSYGSSGASSPYYSGTPPSSQSYGSSGVPTSLSSEAEMARAAMRRTDRVGVQQQQYSQQHSQQQSQPHQPQYAAAAGSPMMGGSPSAQASGAMNPGLYWEKVRSLKDAHTQNLYIAHRALSQHSAPANSAQGIKAENVKHNITLTMNVLSELPKSVQPRPFEVLHSIERFIQNTIIPIVRKVHQQQQSGDQTPQQSSTGAGLQDYAGSNTSASPSVSYGLSNTNAPPSTLSARAARPYAPSPGANSSGQGRTDGKSDTTTPTAQTDSATPPAEGSTAVPLATGSSGGGSAATGAKPPAPPARGKKGKAEAAGAPKIPPRAKQSAVEGKAPPKRLSKAAEAKLAAQQQQQQQQALLHQQGFQSQQQPQAMPQTTAQAASRAAAVVAESAATADGHQSPFGTGASSFDKLSTPTVSPSENRALVSAEESVKTMALDAASKSAPATEADDDAGEDDDALNDFSDFPELDFDDEMPSMKIQFNKENSAFNAKKRSIGDV